MNAAEPGVSCSDLLKALADDTRLHVVRRLMSGPCYVSELNEELQIELTLMSHHLKVLREAGIVEAERDGRAVLYRLSPTVESQRRGQVIELGCCRIDFS